jgi:hypothetical protein
MEEAGIGHDSSCLDILILDALQVLPKPQATPGVVSVHTATADM